MRTPPSRPPTTPHCDLTLARSALLSTGARPLRRRHPASRVRWLCATPVRHARPALALSRLSFTTSTPSPPNTHVRRPHPSAWPHPPPTSYVNTTPFVFAWQRRPSRWPPRRGPRRSPSRSRCVISASLGHRPAHRSQEPSSTPSHNVFIAPRPPPPPPGGERRRRPVRPRGHQGLHRRPQRLRLQGRPLRLASPSAACFFSWAALAGPAPQFKVARVRELPRPMCAVPSTPD